MRTKNLLSLSLIILLLPALSLAAEDPAKYPSKPITLIVGFEPGGAADLTARKLAKLAESSLGQPIIIENRGGGAGVIGLAGVAKADPDGYTIGTFSFSASVYAPHLRKVPFKTKEDFTYIMQFGEYNYLFIVRTDSPWKTLKDFFEVAKKRRLTYATAGALGATHVFMTDLARTEKLNLTHVPYKGSAQQISTVLGGDVNASIVATAIRFVKSGDARALAVYGANRMDGLPDVPTFRELGYQKDTARWVGIAGPKGIPERIRLKLEEAFTKACKDPSFKEFMDNIEMGTVYRNGKQFQEKVMLDYENSGKLLKDLDKLLKE
jgi:tripartite-type tricarboxylate transporter receptor subunit TctC